ncbi:ferrochelatase [Gleimia europaea ACS-120-V-Col10b]|uniref:Coproporphyrin III ferrochelatase n=1 Tax=Gleimia europaea ACS-120-V-Col10b TaxID=883069 RepID=A0A9W5RDX6_9ACTO|nr:ferrochelatase [Gleimia europaea ACS-120-V-Col10b]
MRGLLIVNLGSPDSPAPSDVRAFLAKFLSDPRVVDFPRVVWLPILHGIVLRVRPRKSGAIYKTIWTPEGSPLVVHTKRQHQLLQEALPNWNVKYAMTYTSPSIDSALQEFENEGVDDITVLPLYAQTTPSSSGAVVDQVMDYYRNQQHHPHLRIIGKWPTQPDYVNWHAKQIAQRVHSDIPAPQMILLSYHGVPQRAAHKPEGYRQECLATSSAIETQLRKLGVDTPVLTTFQSKFGPGKWLRPATIDTMASLPDRGVTSVLVASPAFVSDCIETVDELDVLNQDAFKEAGGKHYQRVAPINDDPVIVDIVKDLLGE